MMMLEASCSHLQIEGVLCLQCAFTSQKTTGMSSFASATKMMAISATFLEASGQLLGVVMTV